MMSDGPVHIHIAEQETEVADCVAAYGARPVEWLLDNAEVDSGWCLVHATHMTAAETVGLAQSGAVAGLCPITEANLGDGIFPAVDFVKAGGRFGIGSDSNVLIDAAQELRLLNMRSVISINRETSSKTCTARLCEAARRPWASRPALSKAPPPTSFR